MRVRLVAFLDRHEAELLPEAGRRSEVADRQREFLEPTEARGLVCGAIRRRIGACLEQRDHLPVGIRKPGLVEDIRADAAEGQLDSQSLQGLEAPLQVGLDVGQRR